jgi:hypothetical protein
MLTQTPQDGAARAKERQTELETLLRRFDDELPRHPSLRIEDESLKEKPRSRRSSRLGADLHFDNGLTHIAISPLAFPPRSASSFGSGIAPFSWLSPARSGFELPPWRTSCGAGHQMFSFFARWPLCLRTRVVEAKPCNDRASSFAYLREKQLAVCVEMLR